MKAKIVQVVKKKEPVSYELLAKNLQFYKLQIKELQKKEKEAKDKLDAYIDKTMTADEKGNRFMRFIFEDMPMFVIRQARKTVTVSIDKCKEVLPPKLLKRVVIEKKIEVVDEMELEALVRDEIITMEEFAKITDTKTIYATVISKEKPEEEEAGEEDVSQA